MSNDDFPVFTPAPATPVAAETPDPSSFRPHTAAITEPDSDVSEDSFTDDSSADSDGDDGDVGDTSDGDTLMPATPGGAPRKRRRGSRGGRNRKKKPPGAAGTNGAPVAGADTIDDDFDDDAEFDEGEGEDNDHRGHDWTDAAADRGFTADDVAADAKIEAGLAELPPGTVERPKIGDSRPAPVSPVTGSVPPPPPRAAKPAAANGAAPDAPAADGDAPKKKRRRRGGRGRGKSGGQGSGGQGSGGQGAGQAGGPQPQGSGRVTQVVGGAKHASGFVEGTLDVDDEGFDLDQLDEKTLARRRGQTRKGRPTGRYQMVVRVESSGRSHVAVLEGRALVEHYVAEPADDVWQIDGNIYLGKVQNVLPGMEAAFIDIGTPKNGVLYRGDVAYDAGDVDGNNKPKIESVLRNGQSILVQVTKNPIAHKGARLTQEVSLAGRFVVMVPGQPSTYGISKRLPDDERKRLRRVLDRVRPTDAGLIVRTAAEGATEEELERDMRRLKAQWDQIAALAKTAKPGTLLYKEPPLAIRVIREEFTKEYRSIAIDDAAMYEDVRSYIAAVSPELAERVELHDPDVEPLAIFEKYHVHEQLYKALDPKVWLPSGGSVVIERTEALTVIDVNTGKNVGRSNLEETVFRNNLEAADVIARELRLRDIGGIIVIDFIDMEIKANRDGVEAAFREALARDKTRTQVFSISELGLLEMTRKRVSEGLVEAFSETCPTCEGRGFMVDRTMLGDDS
jgi:ribonuclease E